MSHSVQNFRIVGLRSATFYCGGTNVIRTKVVLQQTSVAELILVMQTVELTYSNVLGLHQNRLALGMIGGGF